MKKALHVIIVLFLFTTIAHAQITKGKTLLGGTIGYGKGTSENVNNNNYPFAEQRYFTISPFVGKVVKENLVVGLQGSFYSQKQEYDNSLTKSNSKGYGGGVFVRRYVPLLKSFYFFGHGAADYTQSNTTQKYLNQNYEKSKVWNAGLSVYPGLAYGITKKFHVEAGLNNLAVLSYGRSRYEHTDLGSGVVSSSEGSSFNVSTSLGSNAGFSIGFRFLL